MEARIVNDNREAVLAELERQKRAYLVAVGKKAEGYAKSAAPVDTGRLRNSITYKADGDQVTLTSNVEYAVYSNTSRYVDHN